LGIVHLKDFEEGPVMRVLRVQLEIEVLEDQQYLDMMVVLAILVMTGSKVQTGHEVLMVGEVYLELL